MKLVVDIDGTICSHEKDYSEAKPYKLRISLMNDYFDAGHRIVYFTARGTETGIDWREVTEKQFEEWGVKYHELHFGQPAGDYYIEDKALHADRMWKLKEVLIGDTYE